MSTLRFGSRLLALAALVAVVGCGGKVVFDGNGSGGGGPTPSPQSMCGDFCAACAAQAGGATACQTACLETATQAKSLGCDDELATLFSCAASQPSCDATQCNPLPFGECVVVACAGQSGSLCSTGGGFGGGG